jgi:hypothetical protein
MINLPPEMLLSEASAIVAWKLYQNEDSKDDAHNGAWINRKCRKDRIQYYRWYHGIPDRIKDEDVLRAISEDWEL